MTFTLDFEGGGEVLKEMTAQAISDLALQVATDADEGATADEYAQISERVTDRFVALVSVPADRQARDGVLTRAASASGLEVRLRQPRKPKASKRKGGASGGS